MAGDRALQQGRIAGLRAAPGGLRELGTFRVGPIELADPAKLVLDVELESSALRVRNRWKFWGFPAAKRGLARGNLVNLTNEPLVDRRYGLDGRRELGRASLVLADKVTPELFAHLRDGGRAILLDHDAQRSGLSRPGVVHESGRPAPRSAILRRPGAMTYWAYWLRCNAQVVERHPALDDFPHDGFSDFQLLRLFGSGAATVDFTPRDAAARKKFRPIIWGLSLVPWTEDASRFGLALAWGGLLSECRVGQGRLLVCNLYVLDGLRKGYPEAGYLLDCLIGYAQSPAFDPPPGAMSAAEFEDVFVISK